MAEPKLRFEDVRKCKDVGEFNLFVQKYLSERDLQGEDKRSTYWALFYEWREA